MASTVFSPKSTTLPLTEEQISVRAYEIFLREGLVQGNDQQNWFQAIEELTTETQIKVAEQMATTPVATGRTASSDVPRWKRSAA